MRVVNGSRTLDWVQGKIAVLSSADETRSFATRSQSCDLELLRQSRKNLQRNKQLSSFLEAKLFSSDV
jgi:hypothetical protein